MYRLAHIFLLAACLAAPVASAAAETVTLTQYKGECHNCGVREVAMGEHTFCALTSVLVGTMNGTCTVRFYDPGGWKLLITDPVDDVWRGETQGCVAMCMDIPGAKPRAVASRSGTGSPEDPGLADRIVGKWAWVSGQTLVAHPDGSLEVFAGGRRINTGRWTREGGGYVFRHREGGWVDTVRLSADGSSLSGTNNTGASLSGKRIK